MQHFLIKRKQTPSTCKQWKTQFVPTTFNYNKSMMMIGSSHRVSDNELQMLMMQITTCYVYHPLVHSACGRP